MKAPLWGTEVEEGTPLSPVVLWWHSLDSPLCILLFTLIGLGIWLILAASPAVAAQHGWSTFVLLKRHLFLVIPGILVMLGTSLLEKRHLVAGAFLGGISASAILWMVLLMGIEIKGARRWIAIGGFSLQPSEFLKPAMAVITAHVLYQPALTRPWNFVVAFGILGAAVLPLFFQPDIGMIFIISAMTFGQCFVAGLPWPWVGGSICVATLGAAATYVCFPHTVHRVRIFFQGQSSDVFGSQYQSLQAVKSIRSGGLWGKGPGAGTLVDHLPDSHSDFIFAVAGEEMGMVMCLLILACYAVLIFRGLWKMSQENDGVYALAILGLLSQLLLQVFLNVGSVLRLIPTKGTTLPFISYGGSSFLSFCWGMGMLLALTRRYRTR